MATALSKVYMTVLSNAAYLPGVKALKRSLEAVGSRYKLVILVPEELENELGRLLESNHLLEDSCILRTAPSLRVTLPQGINENSHYWNNTFFKLRAAGCTEFSKIVLLDCDMLVQHNLDCLFDAPNYSAVVAGQAVHPEWTGLNSGLMVLEPSEELMNTLLAGIEPTIQKCRKAGVNVGDQDVFKFIFPDWHDHRELVLPEKYNVYFCDYTETCRVRGYTAEDIHVVHFVGKTKPWHRFSLRNYYHLFRMAVLARFEEMKIYFHYVSLCR